MQSNINRITKEPLSSSTDYHTSVKSYCITVTNDNSVMVCIISGYFIWDLLRLVCEIGRWVFHSSDKQGIHQHQHLYIMNFALLGLILVIFAALNHSLARIIRVDRQSDGIDHFEVLRDDGDNLCASSAKATEFCAKYGAIHVKNSRACTGEEEALYCQCNSTESTFLLHEERCVKDANLSQYLYGAGGFTGCKNRLVIQDGGIHDAFRTCKKSPVPTLLTNTSDTRRFSVCKEHASQEVVSCTLDVGNSLYFLHGRWRKMWKLGPRKNESRESSLEKILIKLPSNISKWKGLFVHLATNCVVHSQISLRLRGQPPDENIQACLLLKISGSISWKLESYQMNFTQTILRKSVFSDHNKTLGNNEFPGMVSIATQRIPTSSIHVTSKVDEARTDSAWGWPSNFLGAFYGVVVVLIVIITCWLAREEHLRRKKGLDRTGSKRPKRRYTVGNPTYERGRDNSLDLTPISIVNHLDPSPYAVVYQPIMDNARPSPHSTGAGCNNFYDTLKSVSENVLPRRASYKVSRSSKGTATGFSGAESLYQSVDELEGKNTGNGMNESVLASFANSNRSQCSLTTFHPREKPRSHSEGISVQKKSEKKESDEINLVCVNANGQSCFKLEEGKQRPQKETKGSDGGKGVSQDATTAGNLTSRCQPYRLSSQREDERVVENDLVTNFPSSPSPTPKLNERDYLEHERTRGSNRDPQQEGNIARDASYASNRIHDSLNHGLSDLEFVIDTDCSERDETEDQSNRADPFYHVLEGPDPMTLATLV